MRPIVRDVPRRSCFWSAAILLFVGGSFFASATPARAQSQGMLETYNAAYAGFSSTYGVWYYNQSVDVDGTYWNAQNQAYWGLVNAYYGYVYDSPGNFYDCFWHEYYACSLLYSLAYTGRRVDWADRQTQEAFEQTYAACQFSYGVILDRF